MLVIKIEKWPYGDASKATSLGYMTVANTGSGTRSRGKYSVRLFRAGKQERIWKTAQIENFPRLRLSAWDLLYLTLHEFFGTRSRKSGTSVKEEESYKAGVMKATVTREKGNLESHLEWAEEEVKTWPKWKRRILGGK
jgi:hypothetical protein